MATLRKRLSIFKGDNKDKDKDKAVKENGKKNAPKELKKGEFIGAIDVGTTSCRFFVFDGVATVISSAQEEFEQLYPHPNWQEHKPQSWLDAIDSCVKKVFQDLESKGYDPKPSLGGIGITNQRETTVVWDKKTGEPLYNAIAWPDTRNTQTVTSLQEKANEFTFEPPKPREDSKGFAAEGQGLGKGEDAVREITGLPISTYFSGVKLRWMMDHVEEVKKAYEEKRLMWGTVETFLIWKYTGGLDGGLYITDLTNASRTLFLNIHTLEWEPQMLDFLGVKDLELPKIVSNSEVFGEVKGGTLDGLKIAGIIGDQQAALVGNKCFTTGQAKNTYGTGAFLLYNTGEQVVKSTHGLLTTVGYRPGPEAKPVFALEGSIAVAGSSIKWLRDSVELIKESAEIGPLAAQVKDTGGVYFVTGFSGLFAPYWDTSATGLIVGLSLYTTRSHIARATLEATCFQTKAILDAMEKDSGAKLAGLVVDGGMTNSDEAMQIQADLLGIEVDRPDMRETTALGSALMAGAALKMFGWDITDITTTAKVNKHGQKTFQSLISDEDRADKLKGWERAVEKSKGWRQVEKYE